MKTKKREIVLPFDDPGFVETWELWKQFKKEQFRFTYKPIGEQAALMMLSKMASTPDKAIEIIHQSIGNGWRGLFQLKEQNGKQGNQKTLKQRIAEDLAKRYATDYDGRFGRV